MDDIKDLIILGNGMAGMTAALYAKRANLDFKIVGRDEYDFGQIGNAILVENFPCVNSQSGFDLANKLHDQLIANNINIEEHEVVEVSRKYIITDTSKPYNGEQLWEVTYSDDTSDFTRTVIYALGASHRQLECEIEEDAPIHYCALCDGALYKDKTVAIIGGGDVAFTQAEYLAKICKQVYILMCDTNITASPNTVDRIMKNRIQNPKTKLFNIEVVFNYPVSSISRNIDGWVITTDNDCDKTGVLVDGIFVAIGMMPNTKPLEKYMFDVLDKNRYLDCYDDNLKSVQYTTLFGAGDVRLKKVRQGITAASDGAIAVNSVVEELNRYRMLRSNNN